MPLDGISMHALKDELQKTLVNGRISQIYQTSRYELIINIRNAWENFTLLSSIHPRSSRIHLVSNLPESSIESSPFSMLLCKHLERGKILNIEVPDFERIIKFHIESYDNFGRISEKILIFEIMGRRSNIILINGDDGIILDGMIHITSGVNRYRQILPGLRYLPPPPLNKKDPLTITEEEFKNLMALGLNTSKAASFLLDNIQGISPLLSREILFRSDFKVDSTFEDLEEHSPDHWLERLWNGFSTITYTIKKGTNNPTMILDEEGREGVEFSVFHIKQFSQRPKKHFETISELLEAFYTEKVIREKFEEETINLNRIVESNLTRCTRRLSAQKLEAKEARNFDEYRIKGELITANLYRLKRGESQVKAINYYSPIQEEVTIKIDPALSPTENAQRFFKKYTRAKRGLAIIEDRTRSTMEEIDYLESVKLGIEEAETLDHLKEIHDELVEAGYIQVKKKKKDQNHKEYTQQPMAFRSSDDTDILVGKNNRQNDLLTMKMASPEDYWFHVKEIPGSHVILRTRAGVEPSHDAIYEAAMLAAYFSKARNSTNIPVDYTRRKNVRKPSGSKPGMVIYDKYNTIFVTPDPEMLKKVSKEG